MTEESTARGAIIALSMFLEVDQAAETGIPSTMTREDHEKKADETIEKAEKRMKEMYPNGINWTEELKKIEERDGESG